MFNVIDTNNTSQTLLEQNNLENNKIKINIDFIRNAWRNKKFVTSFKDKKRNEFIYYELSIDANTTAGDLELTLNQQMGNIKNNREYEYQGLILVDANIQDYATEFNKLKVANYDASTDRNNIGHNSTTPINSNNNNQTEARSYTTIFKTKAQDNAIKFHNLEEKAVNNLSSSKLKIDIEDLDDILTTTDAVEISLSAQNVQSFITSTNVKENQGKKYLEFEINNINLNTEYIINYIKFSQKTPSMSALELTSANNFSLLNNQDSTFELIGDKNFENKVKLIQSAPDSYEVALNNSDNSTGTLNLAFEISDHLPKDITLKTQFNQASESNKRSANATVESTSQTINSSANNNTNAALTFSDLSLNRLYNTPKIYVKSANDTNQIELVTENSKIKQFITEAGFSKAKQIELIDGFEGEVKFKYEIETEDGYLLDSNNDTVTLILTPTDTNKTFSFSKDTVITKETDGKFYVEYSFENVKDTNQFNGLQTNATQIIESLEYNIVLQLKDKNKPNRTNDNIKVKLNASGLFSRDNVLINHLTHHEIADNVAKTINVKQSSIEFDSTFTIEGTNDNIVENLDNDVVIVWKFKPNITKKIKNHKIKFIFNYFSTPNKNKKDNLETQEVVLDLAQSQVSYDANEDKTTVKFTIPKDSLKHNRVYTLTKLQKSIDSKRWSDWQDNYNTTVEGEFKIKPSAPISLDEANIQVRSATQGDQVNVEQITLTINDPDNVLDSKDANNIVIEVKEANGSTAKFTKAKTFTTTTDGKKQFTFTIQNAKFDQTYKLTKLELNKKGKIAAFDIDQTNQTNKLTSKEFDLSTKKLSVQEIESLDNVPNKRKLKFKYKIEGINPSEFNDVKFVAHFKNPEDEDIFINANYDTTTGELTLEDPRVQLALEGNTQHRLIDILYRNDSNFNRDSAKNKLSTARRLNLDGLTTKEITTSVSEIYVRDIRGDVPFKWYEYKIDLYIEDEDGLLLKHLKDIHVQWKLQNEDISRAKHAETTFDPNVINGYTHSKNGQTYTYNNIYKVSIKIEKPPFEKKIETPNIDFGKILRALNNKQHIALRGSDGTDLGFTLNYKFAVENKGNDHDALKDNGPKFDVNYEQVKNIKEDEFFEQIRYTQTFGSNDRDDNEKIKIKSEKDSNVFTKATSGLSPYKVFKKWKYENLVPNRKYTDFEFFISQNEDGTGHTKKIDYAYTRNALKEFTTKASETKAELTTSQSDSNTLRLEYRITSGDQLWVPLSKSTDANKPSFKIKLTPKNRLLKNKDYYFTKEAIIEASNIDSSDKNVYNLTFDFDIHSYNSSWSGEVTNGALEDGVEYDVELILNTDLTNKVAHDLNITSYSQNADKKNRPILWKEDIHTNKKEYSFENIEISSPGNTDVSDASEQNSRIYHFQDRDNDDITIKISLDHLAKEIHNKKFKLKFIDKENNEIFTEITTFDYSSEKPEIVFKFSDAVKNSLKLNRSYTFADILDDTGQPAKDSYKNKELTKLKSKLSFYFEPKESASWANPAFVKDQTNLNKSTIYIELNDPHNSVVSADFNNNNAQVTYEKINESSEETVAATWENNKIKITIQDLLLDEQIKIKEIKFLNKPKLAVKNINIDSNDNVLKGTEADAANTKLDITNVTKNTSDINNITLTYTLDNDHFNPQSLYFIAEYENLDGETVFSRVATINNNQLTATFDKRNLRHNDRLTLVNIWVGDQSKLNAKAANNSSDEFAKLNLDTLNDKTFEIHSKATSVTLAEAMINNVETDNATIKLNLISEDGFFEKVLSSNNSPKLKLIIQNKANENEIHEVEAELNSIDKNSASIEFSFDNLEDGTTYSIKSLEYTFDDNEFDNLKIIEKPEVTMPIKGLGNQGTFEEFRTKDLPYGIEKFYLEVNGTKATEVENTKTQDDLQLNVELSGIRSAFVNKDIIATFRYYDENRIEKEITFKTRINDKNTTALKLAFATGELKRNREYKFKSLVLNNNFDVGASSTNSDDIEQSIGGGELENTFKTKPSQDAIIDIKSMDFKKNITLTKPEVEIEIEDLDDAYWFNNLESKNHFKVLLALKNDNDKNSITTRVTKVEKLEDHKLKITLEFDNGKVNKDYVLKYLGFDTSSNYIYNGAFAFKNDAIFGEKDNYNIQPQDEKQMSITLALNDANNNTNSVSFKLELKDDDTNTFKIEKLGLSSNVLDLERSDLGLFFIIPELKNTLLSEEISAQNPDIKQFTKNISEAMPILIENFKQNNDNLWNKRIEIKDIYFGTQNDVEAAKNSNSYHNLGSVSIENVFFNTRHSETKIKDVLINDIVKYRNKIENIKFTLTSKDFKFSDLLNSQPPLLTKNNLKIELIEDKRSLATTITGRDIQITNLNPLNNGDVEVTFNAFRLEDSHKYKFRSITLKNINNSQLKIVTNINASNNIKLTNDRLATIEKAYIEAQNKKPIVEQASDMKMQLKIEVQDSKNILKDSDAKFIEISYRLNNSRTVMKKYASGIIENSNNMKQLVLELSKDEYEFDKVYTITKIDFVEQPNEKPSWVKDYYLDKSRNNAIYAKGKSKNEFNLNFGFGLGSLNFEYAPEGDSRTQNDNHILINADHNRDGMNEDLTLFNISDFDIYIKIGNTRNGVDKNGKPTNWQYLKNSSQKTTIRNNYVYNYGFDRYDATFTNNKIYLEAMFMKKGERFDETKARPISAKKKEYVLPSSRIRIMHSNSIIDGPGKSDSSLHIKFQLWSTDGLLDDDLAYATIEGDLYTDQNTKIGEIRGQIDSLANNNKEASVSMFYRNPALGAKTLNPNTKYYVKNLKMIYPKETHKNMTGVQTIMGTNDKTAESVAIDLNNNTVAGNTDNSLIFKEFIVSGNSSGKFLSVSRDAKDELIARVKVDKTKITSDLEGKRIKVIYRLVNKFTGETLNNGKILKTSSKEKLSKNIEEYSLHVEHNFVLGQIYNWSHYILVPDNLLIIDSSNNLLYKHSFPQFDINNKDQIHLGF
ncbi:hypothetical protein [Mesomycoplasma neurolyticum]|uniref:DUF1410 domain-containing protein n=1 Tax=Mesomycoplasma neurolyticum TaxID=2120 RepID=A0A449A5G2_9BACT|nr:hypothetical protein [Mesomycoplasma neurolyticum]VEU59469.1 Uncharacterised protein [Mesomycoplasma neurolyticum]